MIKFNELINKYLTIQSSFPAKIKIENDFIARSPNDNVYQPSPRSSISSSAKSRRNVSGSRNSLSSECGFVSPLHQQSSNKSGQSIRYDRIECVIGTVIL